MSNSFDKSLSSDQELTKNLPSEKTKSKREERRDRTHTSPNLIKYINEDKRTKSSSSLSSRHRSSTKLRESGSLENVHDNGSSDFEEKKKEIKKLAKQKSSREHSSSSASSRSSSAMEISDLKASVSSLAEIVLQLKKAVSEKNKLNVNSHVLLQQEVKDKDEEINLLKAALRQKNGAKDDNLPHQEPDTTELKDYYQKQIDDLRTTIEENRKEFSNELSIVKNLLVDVNKTVVTQLMEIKSSLDPNQLPERRRSSSKAKLLENRQDSQYIERPFVEDIPIMLKPDGQKDQRERTICEILSSERNYVSCLRIVTTVYIPALTNLANEKAKIKIGLVDKIFSNIQQIFEFQTAFLESLQSTLKKSDEGLSDFFIRFAQKTMQEYYAVYGSNYETSRAQLALYKESNKGFLETTQACDSKVNNGLFLKDYLIMPVQRVPRYVMLLGDLIKRTPEQEKDKIASLTEALSKIKQVADAINETIRETENTHKFDEICKQDSEFQSKLNDGERKLLKSGDLNLLYINGKEKRQEKHHEFYLFDDVIVCSALIWNKKPFPEAALKLIWVWVGDIDNLNLPIDENIKSSCFAIFTPDFTWVVAAPNPNEKKVWKAEINLAIEKAGIPEDDVYGLREGKWEFSTTGDIYEGSWKNGLPHGAGVCTNASSDSIFDGVWDSRLKAGFGTITQKAQVIEDVGWKSDLPYSCVVPIENIDDAIDDENVEDDQLLTRDWKLLLTGAKEIVYQPGKVIIEEGSVNQKLFKIKSGYLGVEKVKDGKTITLAEMGPGQMLGEMSVLEKKKATASVVAKSLVMVDQIEVSFIYELFESTPALSRRFHQLMAIKLSKRLRSLHGAKPGNSTEETSSGSEEDQKKTKKRSTSSSEDNLSTSGSEEGDRRKSVEFSGLKRSNTRSVNLRRGNSTSVGLTKDEKTDAEKDKEFNKLFNIKGEVLVKNYKCSVKNHVMSYKQHGDLYISQRYICFSAKLFGRKTKEKLLFRNIKKLKIVNKQSVKAREGTKKLVFIFDKGADDAYALMASLWKQQLKHRDSLPIASVDSLEEDESGATSGQEPDKILSDSDWDIILMGAESHTYRKDEVVVSEDLSYNKIFQVGKGVCRIEKKSAPGQILGKMNEDAMFGEISFLEGIPATASVIADEDDVEIYVIEGDYFGILFMKHADVAGRFYHYLSSLLAGRLAEREKAVYNK